MPLGAIGEQVRKNVKGLREAQGLSTTDLSKRMEQQGRPISPTGITKVEMGDRRVDVGDLVALALALKVTPNRLLLPTDEDVKDFPIMKGVTAPEESLWAWAQAQRALYIEVDQIREMLDRRDGEEGTAETLVQEMNALLLKEEEDFRHNSLPVKYRLTGDGSAIESVRDLFDALNRSLDKVTETRNAASDMDLAVVLVQRLTMVARQTIVLINARIDAVSSWVSESAQSLFMDASTINALRDVQEQMESVTATLTSGIARIRNAARRVDDLQVIASNVSRAHAFKDALDRSKELNAAIDAAKARGETPDPADEEALSEAMAMTDEFIESMTKIVQSLEALAAPSNSPATSPDSRPARGGGSPGSASPGPRRAKRA